MTSANRAKHQQEIARARANVPLRSHIAPLSLSQRRGDRMARAVPGKKDRNADLLRERPLVLVGWALAAALAFQYLGLDLRARARQPDLAGGRRARCSAATSPTSTRPAISSPAGRSPVIYDIPAYRAYQQALFDGAVLGHNYSYTPVSFFYVWLFAPFPYLAALGLWLVLTGAAFVAAARPYLRERGAAGLARADPAGLADEHLGGPLRLPVRRPVARRLAPARVAARAPPACSSG